MSVERTDKTAAEAGAAPASGAGSNHWQHREAPAVDAGAYQAWCDDKLATMMGAPPVQMKGGADDAHERHADAVADAVVAGRSAEHLLDQYGGGAPAVQRKVSENWKGADSWNAGRTEVDSHGHAGRGGAAVPNAQGAAEKVGADAVTRVVLDGLAHAKSKKAVVVVPAAGVLAQATSLDVLLHFHGGSNNQGVGSNNIERGNTAKVGGKQAEDSERTHDLHLAKLPQQLAAHGGNVLAITVERADTDRSDAQDGLVDEVFDYLRAQSLLQKQHVRGRTIISGYSAGAANAVDEAKEHAPGASGATQETAHGLFVFDPAPGSIKSIMAFITTRLEHDLTQLKALTTPADQLAYLKSDGYLVRVFGEEPVFNVNAKATQATIDAWFTGKAKELPADAGVMTQFRSNYQAITVPRQKGAGAWETHGTMEGDALASPLFERHYQPGDGNLEKALGAWRDQHAKKP